MSFVVTFLWLSIWSEAQNSNSCYIVYMCVYFCHLMLSAFLDARKNRYSGCALYSFCKMVVGTQNRLLIFQSMWDAQQQNTEGLLAHVHAWQCDWSHFTWLILQCADYICKTCCHTGTCKRHICWHSFWQVFRVLLPINEGIYREFRVVFFSQLWKVF